MKLPTLNAPKFRVTAKSPHRFTSPQVGERVAEPGEYSISMIAGGNLTLIPNLPLVSHPKKYRGGLLSAANLESQ